MKAKMFFYLLSLLFFSACNKAGEVPKPDLPTSNDPGKGGVLGTISPNIPARIVALLEPNFDSITSTVSKSSDGSFYIRNLSPGKYNLKIVPSSPGYETIKYGSLIVSSGGFTDTGSIFLGK